MFIVTPHYFPITTAITTDSLRESNNVMVVPKKGVLRFTIELEAFIKWPQINLQKRNLLKFIFTLFTLSPSFLNVK